MSEPQVVYIIEGRRYPMVSLDSLSLWDAMDLNKQSGLTIERVEELLRDIAATGEKGAKFATSDDVYQSPEHLMAMVVQMWMARRAAGERDITIREAGSVPLRDWSVVLEGGEEPAADPTSGPEGESSAAA